MAQIIDLKSHKDHRGALTVLEKVLPFSIKRLYWIYDLNGEVRGKHRHKATYQALICLQGSCDVLIKKYGEEQTIRLDKPTQALLLPPEDWHELKNFENNPILLLAASHEYDAADYINEPLV